MSIEEFKKRESEIDAQYKAEIDLIEKAKSKAYNVKQNNINQIVLQFCESNDKLKLKVGDKIQDYDKLGATYFEIIEIYSIGSHNPPQFGYKCKECYKNLRVKTIKGFYSIWAENVIKKTIIRK